MSEAPAPTKPAPTFKVDDRVTIGNNPIPGTISDTRTHHHSKVQQYLVQRDGETRKHWVIADALKPVVADEAVTWTPEAHPESFVIAELPDADPAESIIERSRRLTPDEYEAMFAPKITTAQADVDDAAALADDTEASLNQALLDNYLLERRANQAEQHADAETKRADKLERELTMLQNLVIERQPIPVNAPKVCHQIKTLMQDLDNIIEADRVLTEHYDAGWVKDDQAVTVHLESLEGLPNEKRAVHMRIVTLKKVEVAPVAPQPTRTTSAGATAAAILTGDEVRAERMKQGFEQQVIEHPVTLNSAPATASEVLDKWRGVFSQFTPEEVSANLDRIAGEKALANHKARVANQPDYSTRPLLLTVAVPS